MLFRIQGYGGVGFVCVCVCVFFNGAWFRGLEFL